MLTVTSYISVGKKARMYLNRVRDKYAGVEARALRFQCLDCRIKWDASTFTEPATVSCSNCYGDNVKIVEVEVEYDQPRASA